MSAITVQEAVILHLNRYSDRRPDVYLMPYGMTQDGIAAALGISRAHASLELKKLAGKGHVGSIIAHTPHAKRKRRTYYLEPCGKYVVTEINERMIKERVKIVNLKQSVTGFLHP